MAAAHDPGGFLPHVQTEKKIWENLRFSSPPTNPNPSAEIAHLHPDT